MTERSDGVAVADRERRRKLCRPGRRVAMEPTIVMHTDAHTPGSTQPPSTASRSLFSPFHARSHSPAHAGLGCGWQAVPRTPQKRRLQELGSGFSARCGAMPTRSVGMIRGPKAHGLEGRSKPAARRRSCGYGRDEKPGAGPGPGCVFGEPISRPPFSSSPRPALSPPTRHRSTAARCGRSNPVCTRHPAPR